MHILGNTQYLRTVSLHHFANVVSMVTSTVGHRGVSLINLSTSGAEVNPICDNHAQYTSSDNAYSPRDQYCSPQDHNAPEAVKVHSSSAPGKPEPQRLRASCYSYLHADPINSRALTSFRGSCHLRSIGLPSLLYLSVNKAVSTGCKHVVFWASNVCPRTTHFTRYQHIAWLNNPSSTLDARCEDVVCRELHAWFTRPINYFNPSLKMRTKLLIPHGTYMHPQ